MESNNDGVLYYKWEELPKGVVDVDEIFSMQKIDNDKIRFHRENQLPPVEVVFSLEKQRDLVFDKICDIII